MMGETSSPGLSLVCFHGISQFARVMQSVWSFSLCLETRGFALVDSFLGQCHAPIMQFARSAR
jgi:hypothetical protein